MKLRVLSYNVCDGGLNESSDHRWRSIIDIIRDASPDIALIQEAKYWDAQGGERLFTTARLLGMHACLTPAPLVGCHTVILTQPYLWLRRHDTDYTSLAWHALAPARYDLEGYPHPLWLCSVHLSPWSREHRAHEVTVLDRFAAPDVCAIIGGDFNTPPVNDPEPDWRQRPPHKWGHHAYTAADGTLITDDRPTRHLINAGFTDTARARYETTGKESVLAPTAGFHTLPYRCDQIYVTPPLAPGLAAYEVIDDPRTRQASDHLPIVADFDLMEAA